MNTRIVAVVKFGLAVWVLALATWFVFGWWRYVENGRYSWHTGGGVAVLLDTRSGVFYSVTNEGKPFYRDWTAQKATADKQK